MPLKIYDEGEIVDSGTRVSNIITKVDQVDYAATDQDDLILVTTGAVNRTVSLPSAVGLIGKKYIVEKVDAGVGQVIIDPAGAETIFGAATDAAVNQFDVSSGVSDGENWV